MGSKLYSMDTVGQERRRHSRPKDQSCCHYPSRSKFPREHHPGNYCLPNLDQLQKRSKTGALQQRQHKFCSTNRKNIHRKERAKACHLLSQLSSASSPGKSPVSSFLNTYNCLSSCISPKHEGIVPRKPFSSSKRASVDGVAMAKGVYA